MDQIERADIEGRGNANLAAERCHPFDEVEARPAEIKASVDMRRLDGDEPARVDRLGEAHEEAHGESGAGAMVAAEKFAIERGKFERHWARRSGGRLEGQRALRLCCRENAWFRH